MNRGTGARVRVPFMVVTTVSSSYLIAEENSAGTGGQNLTPDSRTN